MLKYELIKKEEERERVLAHLTMIITLQSLQHYVVIHNISSLKFKSNFQKMINLKRSKKYRCKVLALFGPKYKVVLATAYVTFLYSMWGK